jgi:hypothetical protein
MVGQILPNNNEKCYSNFSPQLFHLNTPRLEICWASPAQVRTLLSTFFTFFFFLALDMLKLNRIRPLGGPKGQGCCVALALVVAGTRCSATGTAAAHAQPSRLRRAVA